MVRVFKACISYLEVWHKHYATLFFRSLVDAVYALKDEVHELKKVSEIGDH